MTTLLGLNGYQSEAMIVCLVASVLWAGALLLGAMHLERSGTARGDRLWIGALLLAILPSLVAPSLAAFGLSLRPAAPAPAIIETVERSAAPASATAAAPRADAFVTAVEETLFPAISLDQATRALTLLYVYGAFLALFIWLARQAGFLAASALADPVRSENLLRAVDDWAFDFGVRTPKLKRSRHVSSVCVYGAVNPVILMPHDLDARVGGDDIALMCAHEIAHLKRGDTRLFTATALARVLFWFNPLVTRIAANVEMAAEEGADRLVIEAGVDRRVYASCFVNGLKYAAMKQSLLPALAPGFTPNDRQARRRRLDQILSASGERRTGPGARAALAGAASIAALIAVGQAAFAVDPEAAAVRKSELLAAVADTPEDRPAARTAPARAEEFAKPVDGDVTLPFGQTYRSLEGRRTPVEHKGVDIKAPRGAPVKASRDGVVVEASTRVPGKEGYGTLVVIDHGHGLVSRYAHLDSYAVAIGQTVRKGDLIGAVGETGLVTGPHLHFEVLKDGKAVDPERAFAPAPPDAPAAPEWVDAEAPPAPSAAIAPVIAVAPAAPVAPPAPVEPAEEVVTAHGFAFANGDSITDRMAADLEHRLLGDAAIADSAKYDISFTFDGETHRFTSDTPMTPEKRAHLKSVLADLRVHRDAARAEMDKARAQWRKDAEKFRADAARQVEAVKREFARTAPGEPKVVLRWREDAAGLRFAAKEARAAAVEGEREALEAELEAISDARDDLADAVADGLDEALADLDAEEAALDDEAMSDEDRRIVRRALADARRSITFSRRDHERELDRARRELDRRAAEIEIRLETLDAQKDDEN